jgi:hypothetical protein
MLSIKENAMLGFSPINVSAIDTKSQYQGNCVARAISLTAGLPYAQVVQELDDVLKNRRLDSRAGSGVPVDARCVQMYLKDLGFQRMAVAPGTRLDHLPPGKWMVQLPRHMTVVKGGAIHDTYDPRKKGNDRVEAIYVHMGYTGLSK